MIDIAGWRIHDDADRPSVKKIVEALADVDPLYIVRACGIVTGNVIADRVQEKTGEGDALEDAVEGLETLTAAILELLRARLSN